MCTKIGKVPQGPQSGDLALTIDPAVHLRAAMAAEAAGKSLDRWAEEVFSEAVNKQQAA